jgi:hypothetical protein
LIPLTPEPTPPLDTGEPLDEFGQPSLIPENCQNGIDDNLDGLIDSQDPDCGGFVSPVIPFQEGTPGSPECQDGIDNDIDGLIDSRDADCLGDTGGLPPTPETEPPEDEGQNGFPSLREELPESLIPQEETSPPGEFIDPDIFRQKPESDEEPTEDEDQPTEEGQQGFQPAP